VANKNSHFTLSVLLHYLVKFENSKLLLKFYAYRQNYSILRETLTKLNNIQMKYATKIAQ